MTVMTTGSMSAAKTSYAGDANQMDTQSTCEMIISPTVNDRLTSQKLLALTLISVTCLMGFFLLAALYIQTSNRCVCAYAQSAVASESQNSPYFEPLKALSSDETSKEMRNFPLRIRMHGNAKDMMNSGSSGGRVSCEITRRTASQIIASEPKELNTPFGNITTDPKLMHLTGEKLYFTCYNGEKPKPVVLVARPRIYAIFHRPSGVDNSNSSSESDENSSSDSSESNDKNDKNSSDQLNASTTEAPIVFGVSSPPTLDGNSGQPQTNIRNKRNTDTTNAMDCLCKCPAN